MAFHLTPPLDLSTGPPVLVCVLLPCLMTRIPSGVYSLGGNGGGALLGGGGNLAGGLGVPAGGARGIGGNRPPLGVRGESGDGDLERSGLGGTALG